jgi:hypothetical protein
MAFFKKRTEEELEVPPPPVKPVELPKMKLPETPDQLPSFQEMRGMPPIPGPKEGPTIPPPRPEMPSIPPEMPEPAIPEPRMQAPPRPRIAPEILQRFEREQYEEEKEELEELEKRGYTGKPIYVLMSQYKQIIADVNEARNILKTAEENALNLNNIKNKADKEFLTWRNQMEDVQRKIIFIDKTLFER